MLDEINEFIRNGFPYFVVLFILCNPSLADSNFNIQRMVQYDSSGINYGCRASAINMEAKSLTSNHNFRSCVVTRFQDMTIDQFREIRSKAGGLIVMLPKNLKSLNAEEKEHIYMLEQAMLAQEISIPVYFSKFDEEIDSIISEISSGRLTANSKQKESAMSEIFQKISANGYQIVVSGASHTPSKTSKIPIIQGELIPFKQLKTSEDGQVQQSKLPVIIVTTQYKTFGLTNDSPPNFDTTVLLTLIDAFSKLYNQVQTTPKYRLIFMLSEGGSLLNFQGAKKWLETNVDEASIQNAEFAICLDSLAEAPGNFYMHVSKPPKEGTSIHKFFQLLKQKTQQYSSGTEEKSVEGVHKKINLADTFLAWGHERFSMKRIAAFTLSSLKSHSESLRTSIFTEYSSTSVVQSDSQLDEAIQENIYTNTKILAEALASYIFNFGENESQEIFTDAVSITEDSIKPYIALEAIGKSQNIKSTFDKFLKNVKVTHDKPDPREPDFMFYEGEDAKLNVYNVKPAIFDLFLTSLIGAYLAAIYFAIMYFPKVYDAISKISYTPSVQANGGAHYNQKSSKVN